MGLSTQAPWKLKIPLEEIVILMSTVWTVPRCLRGLIRTLATISFRFQAAWSACIFSRSSCWSISRSGQRSEVGNRHNVNLRDLQRVYLCLLACFSILGLDWVFLHRQAYSAGCLLTCRRFWGWCSQRGGALQYYSVIIAESGGCTFGGREIGLRELACKERLWWAVLLWALVIVCSILLEASI